MLRQQKRQGSTRFKSHAQEKSLAREFGGKMVVGSGNKAQKGDVSTPKFLIEAKTTAKKSFSVKLYDLDKHYREASAVGKVALFVIQMDDEAKGMNDEWVLIPKSDFLDLTEKDL